MYNSKLEIRLEAVRLATATSGVDRRDLINFARTIEQYVTDGIELPDVYDHNEVILGMAEKLKERMGNESETGKACVLGEEGS